MHSTENRNLMVLDVVQVVAVAAGDLKVVPALMNTTVVDEAVHHHSCLVLTVPGGLTVGHHHHLSSRAMDLTMEALTNTHTNIHMDLMVHTLARLHHHHHHQISILPLQARTASMVQVRIAVVHMASMVQVHIAVAHMATMVQVRTGVVHMATMVQGLIEVDPVASMVQEHVVAARMDIPMDVMDHHIMDLAAMVTDPAALTLADF